ncbi:unnamed protein product, partial [Closterium sp. NIES-53]
SSAHLQVAQQAERAARAAQVETTEARQAAQKLVDRLSVTLQEQSANHSAALSQAHQAAAGLSLAAASLAPFLSHSILPLVRQVFDGASAVQGSAFSAVITPDIVTSAQKVHSECRGFIDLLESVQGATSPLPSSHPHHLSALLRLSSALHQQCFSLLPSISHLAQTTLSALHALRLSKRCHLASQSAAPVARESELAAELPPAGRMSVETLDGAVLAVCRREPSLFLSPLSPTMSVCVLLTCLSCLTRLTCLICVLDSLHSEVMAWQHAEQAIFRLQQKLNNQDPLLCPFLDLLDLVDSEAKARQHAEQVILHLQQKLNKQDPLLLPGATPR